ncbi:preprotein translocase subunit SecY [Thiosulfativibrio zosterae]|uniref:Protein translocase subunit SecY n=1 Tax=Thiosulfativibrio zosterae TaxID=2675053 RepID=A0A6F8PKV2_9GAMM|nr:preprotein translocase subunit SecY [Thiosulfativibrio zosterae]BBP42729.1 protein translocase subunit SecY [Thiosulfativibrio zosterae]
MKSQASVSSGAGELKNKIFFVLAALIIYRLGTHVPVPLIDPIALAAMFEQQKGTILDMFNMFSGGALQRLSILALGIMPYISASIIMQLLTVVSPTLEQIKKDGEAGRRKITQYTRYGTVVLATFQALGVAIALESQNINGMSVVVQAGFMFKLIAVVTLVSGTIFLMWLGEQITERGIGNGISLIIFAGIVAGLPSALGGTFEQVNSGALHAITIFILLALVFAVIAFVVFVERGQRRIPIHYAQQMRGRKFYGGQEGHLPLKLNMAGVIPPIFASSIILFPATLGGWFGSAENLGWLKDIATTMSPGQPLYILFYAMAIIFFCFFYTAIVFNPDEIADNLKKSGAQIQGLRPGPQTARKIDSIMGRLTLAGAVYITAVCLLPEFLILYWNVPFYFGGTSLLIIVIVVMDFMTQIQTHMQSGQYEKMMKKANLKGR